MLYRLRVDGSLKTQGEIRILHPNTSLPAVWDNDVLEMLDIDEVGNSERPVAQRYQKVIEDGVQNINGQWKFAYKVVDMTDEEKAKDDEVAAAQIRGERNRRLAKSDWTQLADAAVDKEAWATYRQSLRDITAQPGFPNEVLWPSKP